MPIYEYDCNNCGDFTALRKMAERAEPCACPVCGAASDRVILSAPSLASVPRNTRVAMDRNEQSRHEPKTPEQYRESRRHPSGCSCCGPSQPLAPSRANPQALKTRAGGRPWMISH